MQNQGPANIHLKIESQAFGGYGVGRHDGKVYFVPDTIQGDEVLVRITESKKNFAYASVIEVLSPSKLRIASLCKFDSECGGCQWQSVPYEQQLVFKEAFLRDALYRTGKITLEKEIHIHHANSEYYRNRALFRGTIDDKGCIRIGFMERASHTQVPIDHCRNVDPLINRFISELMQLKTKTKAQKFRMEVQVLPAAQAQGEPPLVIVLHALHGVDALRSLQKSLVNISSVRWVGFATELTKAPVVLWERDLDLDFYTCPGNFQQVHLTLNHKVRRLIKTFAEHNAVHSVLDLFCGSGNLSLGLAQGRKILGVEQVSSAIRVAKMNVSANHIHSASYVCAPAQRFLQEQAREAKSYDLLIADPPRAGMKECIPLLVELGPRFIAYMSCDPVTLARDLKELLGSYEILDTHLLDFFPNTYHLESLVFLKRSN